MGPGGSSRRPWLVTMLRSAPSADRTRGALSRSRFSRDRCALRCFRWKSTLAGQRTQLMFTWKSIVVFATPAPFTEFSSKGSVAKYGTSFSAGWDGSLLSTISQ